MLTRRRPCRVTCRAVQPPRRIGRQPTQRRGFGLRAFRSPLLRACSLFLGVREMFQFPRFPPDPYTFRAGSPVSLRGDCSIRAPLALSVGAAPQGVSPRPRALHRPRRPRHPPRAHPYAAIILISSRHRDSYGRFLCILVVEPRITSLHHRYLRRDARCATIVGTMSRATRPSRISHHSLVNVPAQSINRSDESSWWSSRTPLRRAIANDDCGGPMAARKIPAGIAGTWWSHGGSNPEPPPCKGGALPIEL